MATTFTRAPSISTTQHGVCYLEIVFMDVFVKFFNNNLSQTFANNLKWKNYAVDEISDTFYTSHIIHAKKLVSIVNVKESC